MMPLMAPSFSMCFKQFKTIVAVRIFVSAGGRVGKGVSQYVLLVSVLFFSPIWFEFRYIPRVQMMQMAPVL